MPLRLRRSLSTLPLVFVMFFNVSGGAYSLEQLVSSTGAGLALIILAAVPIVWSLPEVLIVGELASAVPEEGGYYRWVRRAFGEFWAFQNGWWTWLYSLVDMAIYPVLLNTYLAYFIPDISRPVKWMIALAMIWGATVLNLRGVSHVGRASMIAGTFVLAAFGLLAIGSIPHIVHSPFQPMVAAGKHVTASLGVGLSIALWNYVGWDNASTVEGEIIDPSRNYPRALWRALPLVALAYLVPLLPALAATSPAQWYPGSWPEVARAAVGGTAGRLVGILIAAGGIISAIALFNALLMAYSRIPFAMAVDRLIPGSVATVNEHGVPRNAVLISAVFYSVFALAPFGELVVADVVLYSLALFLEFAALIHFRRREPNLRGVFRIPAGTAGVIFLASLPVSVLLVVIALGVRDGTYALPALIGSLAGVLLGPVLYFLIRPRFTTPVARQ
ncbi:MAG: APC family permease [Gemmatimonadota bacterium]|nr:APC family permease [Gemmatimonadota bacterium]